MLQFTAPEHLPPLNRMAPPGSITTQITKIIDAFKWNMPAIGFLRHNEDPGPKHNDDPKF